MALKLYIAYGTGADQITALRLQALGAVNGLSVYVPPAYTRRGAAPALDQQSLANLETADVILGVITSDLSEACRSELNTGKQLGKNIVVMAAHAWARDLEPYFPGSIIAVDPANPAETESGIVQHLKKAEMEQDASKALIAIGTLALGLLLFAPQE